MHERVKLGTSWSKQAHNGHYSDVNMSYLQFSLKWIEQVLFVIEIDFHIVVLDKFSGLRIVNFIGMVYGVCIVDDFNSELSF